MRRRTVNETYVSNNRRVRRSCPYVSVGGEGEMGSFTRGMVSKVLQNGRQPLLCKDISGLTSASLRLNHLSTHHPLDGKAVGDILGAGGDSVSRTPRLTTESARRLANNFTPEDRQLLLKEIQEIKGDEAIMKYSGSLASLRWRSRVGRPASFGESDPSGRFCVIPTNWLKQRLAQSIPKPTASQLIHTALFNSIPFIGFGFLDNVIMITAGDYIEASMGVALGISTMAAAALGNAVSDVAGIGSAFYVELIAMRIGIPAPTMTAEQQDLKISHWFSNLGRAFGVALGCLLGMFPLMFLPGHNKETADTDVAPASGAPSVAPLLESQSQPAPAKVESTCSTTQEDSCLPCPRLPATSETRTATSPVPSHLVSATAEHPETSTLDKSNQKLAKDPPGK